MPLENFDFYNSAYRKYGLSARGLNWNSEQTQKIRFKIITHFLKDEIFTCKVVDAGCGFADLFFYWRDNGKKVKSYIGIDSFEKFVTISKKRLKKHPECSFTCKDILKDELPYADWYIASGSLNILSSFDTWLFLEKMLMYSKKGIVFNILEGDKKSENFNYQKREDIINFAQSKGLKMKFRDDYMKNDICVELRK